VVTGLGAVSALGLGAEELWSALLAGRVGAGPSPPSPRGIPVPALAGTLGEVGKRIDDVADPRYLRRLAAISRSTVAAAALACRGRQGDKSSDAFREATGVLVGTSYGASSYHFEYYEKLFRNGLRDASPLLFSESVMNAAPGHVSLYLKLRGASAALVGGEEAGLTALADALDRIRLGDARAVLAGGAEEYCDFVHAGLARAGIAGGERGEPFAGTERGSFFAEGAALLLLEEAAGARADGLEALAVLAGAGAARAGGVEDMPAAVEKAVRRALADAGVEPASVGLVVSSASGGPLDRAEALGLERALGGTGEGPIYVAAPKANLGEGFAFTSAVEALVAALAVARGVVPPGLAGEAGSAAPADLPPGFAMPGRPVETPLAAALAVSLNRLGNAVAVVFRRPEAR
jgi:3-oxoacyl-(acyl-carrier-protein) synthase